MCIQQIFLASYTVIYFVYVEKLQVQNFCLIIYSTRYTMETFYSVLKHFCAVMMEVQVCTCTCIVTSQTSKQEKIHYRILINERQNFKYYSSVYSKTNESYKLRPSNSNFRPICTNPFQNVVFDYCRSFMTEQQ